MKLVSRPADLLPRPRQAAVALVLLVVMFFVARANYLLFHTAAEGFAIVVAALIYVVANKTYRNAGKDFLLFLGNAYLFVALLDFVHALTYQGMGVFPGYTANTPTQLWIASRYVDALSLLAAPLFLRRRYPRRPALLVYAVVTALLVASIMWWKVFPDAFVPGQGLTAFKVGSEYVISLLLLGAIWHLSARRKAMDHSIYLLLVVSMAITILAELSFTLYTDVYGLMNFVGHIFKIVAYYLVFRGIVVQGLEAPYTEIQRLNEDLEQRVRERTALLEAEIAERKQAEQFREEYVSLVSHDLRNPLSGVMGMAQLLQRNLLKNDLTHEAQVVEVIIRNAKSMAAMIDDLVASARLEAGQIELDVEPVDLAQLVSDLAESLGAPEDRERVRVELAAALPPVPADREQLGRAIGNLVGNALKYSPAGAPVVVRVAPRDGAVELAVADQGVGIPAEDLPHVFERHFRARTAGKREGSGLGLYITRLIVEAHSGEVRAESEPGTGSTFYLSLPLVAETA